MEHNPPKHDPDMPNHEHYATEGKTKMYRPKVKYTMSEKSKDALKKLQEEGRKLGSFVKEHELPCWEGRDHS